MFEFWEGINMGQNRHWSKSTLSAVLSTHRYQNVVRIITFRHSYDMVEESNTSKRQNWKDSSTRLRHDRMVTILTISMPERSQLADIYESKVALFERSKRHNRDSFRIFERTPILFNNPNFQSLPYSLGTVQDPSLET